MAIKKRRPLRSLLALALLAGVSMGSLIVGNVTNHGASFVPSLALDLEGGTQLILTPVSTDNSSRQVTEDDIAEAINIIRSRVDASGVAEAEITSMGSDNIVVAIPGTPSQETLDLIRSSSQMNFRPVLKIGQAVSVQRPTTPSAEAGQSDSSAQSGQSSEDAQSATDEQSGDLSASEGSDQSAQEAQSGDSAASGETAQSAEADNSQSAPQIQPNVLSEEEAKTLADANKDGELSDAPATTPENNSDLAWMTEKVTYDYLTLDCGAKGTRTEAAADKPYAACNAEGTLKYILGPVDVSGSQLTTAAAAMITNNQGRSTGEWGVDLQFNAEGTTSFAEASERLYGFASADSQGGAAYVKPDRNHFAVVLDGKIITAPSMNAVINNGRAQISGSFTATSAKSLANQLNFGSLPLNFEVQSEQQISATLGSEHLQKGIWAGLIGLLLVVAYMVWQYRGLSVVSAGSLLVAGGLTYLVITLLSWTMGYRLSLAGIAGLIVAVGVTADSFIVYFERIRDEVRDGRPLVAAVDEGWQRAKHTIIVSDAVNLVAAVVLYVLAVGGVQGFAFTLGVTTIVDLIVIFLFTHPMMELLIRTRFFGSGHKLSGLDPEHLGATSAAIYAGRGRIRVNRGAQEQRMAVEDAQERPLSIAERRYAEEKRQEALEKEAEQTSETSTTEGATQTDDGSVEEKEQNR
ncbi:protein translocase subunit SecD [Schaalia sp. lx-260]|uniref:protein translocase subunit SecD n=1 Tax=Schaalia sp. lx-260 TaxID=2899082 RepID=UPI001E63F1F1|nr:protein translocase subunit SecD [Schaalia sp. lx-260]